MAFQTLIAAIVVAVMTLNAGAVFGETASAYTGQSSMTSQSETTSRTWDEMFEDSEIKPNPWAEPCFASIAVAAC